MSKSINRILRKNRISFRNLEFEKTNPKDNTGKVNQIEGRKLTERTL